MNSHLQAVSLIGSLGMALMVMLLRFRAAARPVNAMKIWMPPLGMSTGFFMFAAPSTRIPWLWALCAFAIGVVFFAYPLIRTSRLTARGGAVYMERSKAFMGILLLLLAVRLLLHEYVEAYVSIFQTGALFFILAFGMIVPWRVAMYVRYRRLLEQSGADET
ncbi:cytochrome c biogenesis protein CcdC [Paenibacillus athensensis]|uniref:Membrane protein CcdC involved in cytochrome C biogenesis n=1 Tax=Paenibacillus athensensis TaxID=1967502 RepID=A0A4Y8PTI9_9BACL|nr:cytochrome c biogenesis protein CcdC [Paenibacillus athensensis]